MAKEYDWEMLYTELCEARSIIEALLYSYKMPKHIKENVEIIDELLSKCIDYLLYVHPREW